MCLTQILKMLRGGGAKKAEDTTKYSRVGGAGDAHTDTDDQWDDVDDNWDWTADTGAAVDVEAGAGSGGGVGASGAPQASARQDVAASASPVPAGVSVTNGAPSSGNGASGIAMTTRDTGAPLRVADPVVSAPLSSDSRRPLSAPRRPSPPAPVESPKKSASNLFMELGMQPKIRAAKRIDPATAPKTHRIDVDTDDEDFGAEWDVDGDDLDSLTLDAPVPAAEPQRPRRGGRKKKSKKSGAAAGMRASLGAKRI